MEYIFLLFSMCSSAALSVMSSLFGRKNPDVKNSSGIYTAILTASAFLTWGIICWYEGGFNLSVIPYSLLFGILYTLALIGMFKAYQTGSVSLTAFIKQLSLIGVAFWGLVFWNNPLSTNIILGLILVVIALYLCFKPDKTDSKKTTTKWLLYALMLLVGNAGCSIVQKYQQLGFDSNFKSLFMFFGTGVSFISSLIICFNKNQCKLKDIKKKTVIYPIIGGISSALLNLFILILISSTLSESIIFPGIAIGGLIFTLLFSFVVYHEKLRRCQWLGLAIGIIALTFLNL